MIEPVLSEADWIPLLGHLPFWTPPRKPIVLISPHPDDETLGAGGFIAAQRAKGVDVTVVAVTDGERAYGDGASLREVRRNEQVRALARLGVAAANIVRFELPDCGVERHEEELIEKLIPLVSIGTLLVAPWHGDFHPDHKACGRAAEKLAHLLNAQLVSYFFWTWHMGEVDVLADLPLRNFAVRAAGFAAKSEALLEHRSQLFRRDGKPILTNDLLWPARRRSEVFSLS